MTSKVNSIPLEQFVALWNAADSLDEATTQVQAIASRPAPRWAVMARATACRKDGIDMKRLEASGVKAMG